jgi:aquaporin Z
MNKVIVEFIGTFFLVFTIGCVVLEPGAGAFAPIPIGLALAVMIYAGGHISGGHYNPAVSLAVWLRGKLPTAELPGYIIGQVAAALAAGLAVKFLKAGAGAAPVAMTLDVGKAFLAEFLFTFALAYVVLNAATAKANEGNSFYGLAIGGTVLTGAFAVGGISGGAFNPAVAIGASFLGLFSWNNLWVYLVAELLGGAAAAFIFKMVSVRDAVKA